MYATAKKLAKTRLQKEWVEALFTTGHLPDWWKVWRGGQKYHRSTSTFAKRLLDAGIPIERREFTWPDTRSSGWYLVK